MAKEDKNISMNGEKHEDVYNYTGIGSDAKYKLTTVDSKSGDQTFHIIECKDGCFEKPTRFEIRGEWEWNEFCEFIKEVSNK
jgi:hypothetical protein